MHTPKEESSKKNTLGLGWFPLLTSLTLFSAVILNYIVAVRDAMLNDSVGFFTEVVLSSPERNTFSLLYTIGSILAMYCVIIWYQAIRMVNSYDPCKKIERLNLISICSGILTFICMLILAGFPTIKYTDPDTYFILLHIRLISNLVYQTVQMFLSIVYSPDFIATKVTMARGFLLFCSVVFSMTSVLTYAIGKHKEMYQEDYSEAPMAHLRMIGDSGSLFFKLSAISETMQSSISTMFFMTYVPKFQSLQLELQLQSSLTTYEDYEYQQLHERRNSPAAGGFMDTNL